MLVLGVFFVGFVSFFKTNRGEITDLHSHSLFPLFSHGQRSLKLSVPVFVRGNTVNSDWPPRSISGLSCFALK